MPALEKHVLRSLLLLLVPALLAPASLSAQSSRPRLSADYLFKAGNTSLTLSAGGSAFTDFQQDPARLLSPLGTTPDFTRRISAQTSALGAAAFTVWVSRTIAIQVQGSYTPTRFRVTNEGDPGSGGEFDGADTTRYARLDLWMADASMLLRPPVSFGRVSPYAILGAGVVRFNVGGDTLLLPPEARGQFGRGGRSQVTGVIGAGAVIPLQRRRLLLTFDITDHLTRTPLGDRASTASFDSGGKQIMLRPDGVGDDGITLTSNVRLAVGLTIPLRLR